MRHTREINERRAEKIQWKYYQYLALLFTEIYLDRYFSDRNALLEDINAFLHDNFNHRPETWQGMPDFTDDDLNKLAFWCATGSGKTLMMQNTPSLGFRLSVLRMAFTVPFCHHKAVEEMTPNK